jgi:hypothetical protein
MVTDWLGVPEDKLAICRGTCASPRMLVSGSALRAEVDEVIVHGPLHEGGRRRYRLCRTTC